MGKFGFSLRKSLYFSHENSFPEYNNNGQKLEELKAEYQIILERLDELEQHGVIGAFDKRTIIDLSWDVINEIAQKYENVQKGRKRSCGPLLCADRSGA